MPLMRCQKNGKKGWKFGQGGSCFIGPGAREKARKQGVAIKISQQKRGKAQKIDRPSIMFQVIDYLKNKQE